MQYPAQHISFSRTAETSIVFNHKRDALDLDDR